MDVSVSDAKGLLTDLVRRAEQGEEIVLTRHGRPVARIAPVIKPRPTQLEKRAILAEIRASARRNITPGPTGEELQTALYDEFGMPN